MIGSLLRSLGVNVTDEHIQMLETLIPQLPEKINQIITINNQALMNFDGRLKYLEESQLQLHCKFDQILEHLHGRRDNPADCDGRYLNGSPAVITTNNHGPRIDG